MCGSFFLIKNLVSYLKALGLFLSYSSLEFDVVDININQSSRIIDIMKKYEELDLADMSLVILAEHLHTGDILTVDNKDLNALRWNNKRFKQLLS